MKLSLKKLISPSIPLSVLLVAACGALWFLPLDNGVPHLSADLMPLSKVIHDFNLSELPVKAVCLVLTLLNAFLLLQLNNKFTLIRQRTFLLFFLYFFVISIWNTTHYLIIGNFAATMIIGSFFTFLQTYDDNVDTAEPIFLGSFMIAFAGFMLLPEFLVFIIPAWLGLAMLKSISLRTFLASIIGLAAPLLFCLLFVDGYSQLLITHFYGFQQNTIKSFYAFSIVEIIYMAIFLIISVIFIIGIYSNIVRDIIRTRININFTALFFFFTLAITALFSYSFSYFLPIIAALFAIIAAHPLTVRKDFFYQILFWFFFGVNIVYLLIKLII